MELRFPVPLATLFAGLSPARAETLSRPGWRRHFDAAGVRGTFLAFEPAAARYQVLDEARARRGFLPASTFQVPNAVIGLETGAIADEHERFGWDGRPKLRRAWERDHTLASGMRESVVWMFQEVARRVGRARMREWLERIGYGNASLAGGIDHFWLQGGLRVSAYDQVALLHRLAEGRLPATQRAQRLVREALVAERTRGCTLYARTGTSGGARQPVAWWTGWVERQGRPVAYFAMNYEPRPRGRYGERFDIGRAILHEVAGLPLSAPLAQQAGKLAHVPEDARPVGLERVRIGMG